MVWRILVQVLWRLRHEHTHVVLGEDEVRDHNSEELQRSCELRRKCNKMIELLTFM